ncbi:hypothetical protein BGZ63DRAFT_421852 [Mariannaea sp. PMI_226]|nr:hypothetical protein BGZ63DRAFT_421852 [Mariannaea sp. PMI_226]
MGFIDAIHDFFYSIYELIVALVATGYDIVQSLVSAIVGFVTGLFTLVGDVASGMVKAAGGVGKFITGNIVLITIGALGAFAYVRFTAQGRRLAEGKKTQ